jgi:hypothetical protein
LIPNGRRGNVEQRLRESVGLSMREWRWAAKNWMDGESMANPEHAEIVKQGAKAIRAWREGKPHSATGTLD